MSPATDPARRLAEIRAAAERMLRDARSRAYRRWKRIGADADRTIDVLTGVPVVDGPIEQFRHAGATLIAEQRGDTASDTTFVLVHGIGMGRKVFADLTHRLQSHGLVIAVDQPGYGEAPEPKRTPTMARTADLLAAYLRHIDRGPVVLIGHSMGAQVAVETAARHPELVARLVLVAPTVDPRGRRARTQLWRLGVDLLDESPKVLLLGAREYLRAGPHLRRKMRAMLVHRPEDALGAITAPTLVMRGEHDPVSPREWCEQIVAGIADATFFEVPGRGHETLIRDAAPAASVIVGDGER